MIYNRHNKWGLPREALSGARLQDAAGNSRAASAFNPVEGWWEEWVLQGQDDGNMETARARWHISKVQTGPDGKLVTLRVYARFTVTGGDGRVYFRG